MPVYKESKFAEYLEGFKAWRGNLRTRLGDWKDAVREEPVLIWQTTAIRYSVYAIAGCLGLSAILWGLSLFHPPQAAPPAKTADFHVLCTNPSCGRHFVINRKFNFDDFPVPCPVCKQKTGQQAMRCSSKQCGGQWVVPKTTQDRLRCPICAEDLGKAD